LRRHSAESLIHLCRDHQPILWSPRRIGYRPQFSFRPLEVLLDSVGVFVPDGAELAEEELMTMAGPELRSAAFAIDRAEDLVVPVVAVGDAFTVQTLRTLGRWAMLVPTATHELGSEPSFALASTASGETIAVWWRHELLYTVLCEDRQRVASVAM